MSQAGMLSSALRAFVITPSGTVDLPETTKHIYVGGASGGGGGHSDVTIMTVAGATILFRSVRNGSTIPVQAVRVMATGTTPLSGLVGLA